MLGFPNASQDEKDTIDENPLQSIRVGHFEGALVKGRAIEPRDMRTVTVTDIAHCPFAVGESSPAVSQSPATNTPDPNFPNSFAVGGDPPPPTPATTSPVKVEPSNFPSGFDVTAPGGPGRNTNSPGSLANITTTTSIDPGTRATALHVNPLPPVEPPVAISPNGNSTIPAENATVAALDPSSPQNSTSTQDPPSSVTPISIHITSSTHKSSSTSIPIAHSPSNVLGNTPSAVPPASPSNPKPATSNSLVVDGDPASSQNVASTPNNGSVALRARAVETQFERSNWTWRNSISRRMKAQITPRALPKIVDRDQDPTTVIQGAVVCVIVPQIVAASPPSSPSVSYIGASFPIPNPPLPAPPVASPSLSASSAPAPAPTPASAPTTTYLGDVFTSILRPTSIPASPDRSRPSVETTAPRFTPPNHTPIISASFPIIQITTSKPTSLSTILGAMPPFASFSDTEPVVTVTDFNTDGQPISTRVVEVVPTTITELNSDGQPTATRTLDPFTTIVETDSAGQLISVVVNDPLTTVTELDQSGQPTATIISNVPLTTITIYDSSEVPIATTIASVTSQSDLVQSSGSVSSVSNQSGSSKGAQGTTTSTRIITISLEAPTPTTATTTRHSGAGRSVENSRMRLSCMLVALGGFVLGGLF